MRVLLLTLCGLLALVASKSYEGYKVYEIIPHDVRQLEVLHKMDGKPDVDFWSHTKLLGARVVVKIGPQSQWEFTKIMVETNMHYRILIDDVDSMVQEERKQLFLSRQGQLPRISFKTYHRYDEINAYLNDLASRYPNMVKIINIGKSYEGRDLNMLHISTGGNGNRPAFLVDGGIHAREWIAPAQTLYIIQQLVENQNATKDLTDQLDWYILPVVNPDGYEYTFTDDRLWRKTRSYTNGECAGVDGNRNWDFHWNEGGASDYPCFETYAGKKSFSEPEIIALSEFGLKMKDQIKLYLSLHSFGELILYPWGYTSDYPSNADELQELGDSVNKAMGNKYTVGNIPNILYPAAGGSLDWFKGVVGSELSYTIELPGGGSTGFDLPPSKIQGVVVETFPGIRVFAEYVINKFVS